MSLVVDMVGLYLFIHQSQVDIQGDSQETKLTGNKAGGEGSFLFSGSLPFGGLSVLQLRAVVYEMLYASKHGFSR